MTRAVAVLLLPLLAAPLPAAKSDPLAGRVAGPPRQCINLSQTGANLTIVDATTIEYRQSGRRLWRTSPVGGCPGMRPLNRLVIDAYGTQVCRNDRFRTVEPNLSIPGPYCRFGAWTPYDKR